MEWESNVSPKSNDREGDRIRISHANVREVVRAVQVIILPDQDAYGRTDGAVNIRSNTHS